MALVRRAAACAAGAVAIWGVAATAHAADVRVDFSLACLGCAPQVQAVPVVGSFSYRASATGVLGLLDLTRFDLSLRVTDLSAPASVPATQSRQFDLADIQALASAASSQPSSGFFHFAWDATSRSFLEGHAGPGWTNDGAHVLHLLAAAVNTPVLDGFRIDRLPPAGGLVSQAVSLFVVVPGDVPSGRSYVQPYNNWTVQVTAVPEPSALAMTLVGFGLWVASRRRPTRHSASSTRPGAVL